jgi:hypothetical protein
MNKPPAPIVEPQIVFLGLCERANYVRDGNTNVFKWNVLGIKYIAISHIYPLKLDGWAVGFAIHDTAAETGTKFRLSDENGNEIGTIDLFAGLAPSDSDHAVAGQSEVKLTMQPHGWTTFFVSLAGTGWIIPAPGLYSLEHISSGASSRAGTLQFAVVDAAPLSADRIAAIKSDPNASRSVRTELGCNHCTSKNRAYASLDRNEKSEEEGWVWYQDSPDFFNCECGKTSIDLQYIRRNLHGLLGLHRRVSDHLSFMPLYEKSSLASTRIEFAKMCSRSPREEVLQQFLNENPVLLHQFPAERILPKPPILTSYVADFGIVTPQKELILIELEKTATRLMKKDGGMAAPLSHAFDQVRDWLHEVDEHRLAVLDSLHIDRDEVSAIRGVVIAGRDSGYDARDLRKLKGNDYGRISFLTYDDLLFSLDALILRFEGL